MGIVLASSGSQSVVFAYKLPPHSSLLCVQCHTQLLATTVKNTHDKLYSVLYGLLKMVYFI